MLGLQPIERSRHGWLRAHGPLRFEHTDASNGLRNAAGPGQASALLAKPGANKPEQLLSKLKRLLSVRSRRSHEPARVSELCGIRSERVSGGSKNGELLVQALALAMEFDKIMHEPKSHLMRREESLEHFFSCLLAVEYGGAE